MRLAYEGITMRRQRIDTPGGWAFMVSHRSVICGHPEKMRELDDAAMAGAFVREDASRMAR